MKVIHANDTIIKLQKKGVIEILLYLLENKVASRKDLRDNITAVLETIYKTSLPTLKELGLIQEVKKEKFPFTVEIFLTEKGEKLASLCVDAQKILESDN